MEVGVWANENKRRLVVAIFDDVLQVLHTYPRASAIYQAAVAWLGGAPTEGISFELACAVLDFDPVVVREKLAGRASVGPVAERTADGVYWHAHECAACARRFVSGIERQKYCSSACNIRAYRARKRERRRMGVAAGERTIPKTCAACGTAFLARLEWAKYCSPQCAVRGRAMVFGSYKQYRKHLARRHRREPEGEAAA